MLQANEQLAIFARLQGRRCVVVGGGPVASRKAGELVEAGADVTVVAPELDRALAERAAAGSIEWRREAFVDTHLDDAWLVVAATSDRELNARVADAAEARRIFCNVVDDPALCSFIMPAVVRRDPVTIAISSGGHAPVIARWVKGIIESLVPQRLGALATLAGEWRQRIKAAFGAIDTRRRFWEHVLEGPVAEHSLAGRPDRAEAALEHALADWQTTPAASAGEAYIVGAGPGSADLLTLRGRQLLAQAEVVLYDRLVGDEILEFARRDAELISVGKQAGRPSITQPQIDRLLVQLVKSGKRVCRLKGGDPMIFGRGGEEVDALVEAGLPFQVVPGVSAALACAAYAGIPLTLRGVTQTVLLTTGHTESSANIGLGKLPAGQTLSLYMGVARYSEIADTLLEAGNAATLPVAIVERGTLPEQRVIVTTLGELAAATVALAIESPALLLIGATTALAERNAWFAPERVVVYNDPANAITRTTKVAS
jgi:uroporphyrin-III C-methyltransferase/precorrin-2 dehydrogenase/sirohydrochlorin ferrochelatase